MLDASCPDAGSSFFILIFLRFDFFFISNPLIPCDISTAIAWELPASSALSEPDGAPSACCPCWTWQVSPQRPFSYRVPLRPSCRTGASNPDDTSSVPPLLPRVHSPARVPIVSFCFSFLNNNLLIMTCNFPTFVFLTSVSTALFA